MSDWCNINGLSKNQPPKLNSASGEAQKPDDSTPISFEPSDEILAAFAEAEASKQSTAFTQTVQRVQHICSKLTTEIPNEKKGVNIPKPELLYHTKPETLNSGEANPTVLLLPEQHTMTGHNPFQEQFGISSYASKVINCHLLKELFGNPELDIQKTFHEFSVKLADDMQADFESCVENEKIPAFNYASHLSRTKGSESIPAEDLNLELKTMIERFLYLSILFTEVKISEIDRSLSNQKLNQLLSSLPDRSVNNLRMQMSILVNQVNKTLEANSLNDDSKKTKFEEKLQEIESTISPHSFVSFNHKKSIPEFDLKNYANIPKLARRSFLNYLRATPIKTALERDEAMAKNFKKETGVIPMIIGGAHVPNLINELEGLNIPVCVIGPQCYHNAFAVDIRSPEFKAKLTKHKEQVTNDSLTRLAAVRNHI